MTYELAPATAILATDCACCGRALLDAVSVEAGVGPECRRKYGYSEPQGAADWARASRLLAGDLGQALASAWGVDARCTANVLVHAIAAHQGGGRRRGAWVAAVDALGFATLAARLLARAHGIVIEDAGGGVLRVRTPFSAEWNEAVRGIPGQRWIEAEKVRTVPARSRAALWAALKRVFPAGTLVSGPKGLAVL